MIGNNMKSALMLALGLGAASVAQAGFLGNSVLWEHLHPDKSTLISNGAPPAPPPTGTVTVVDPGAEFILAFDFGADGVLNTYTANLSDTTILIDFLPSPGVGWLFNPGSGADPFNGPRFSDSTSAIADIVAVTISASSAWSSFTASRIAFDANNIYLDFQNLTGLANEFLSLDVCFAGAACDPNALGPNPNPTPEPATLALLGFGLTGLGWMRRRKS